MNHVNDHDPFPELDRLGPSLQRQAAQRRGDLGQLTRRAHQRAIRARGSAVAATALLGVGAIAVFRAPGDGSEFSTAGSGGGDTSGSALPTDGETPRWTVNRSIPTGSTEPVWALRIEYDPAVYDFMTIVRKVEAVNTAPDTPRGGGVQSFASQRDLPVIDAYANPPGGEAVVRAVQENLTGQPGIVRVEIGLAVDDPTRGTRPVGSVPS